MKISRTIRVVMILGFIGHSSIFCVPILEDNVVTLFDAAERGDTNKIKEFIDAGTDVNTKPLFGGKTPLHLAIDNGHYDAIRSLIGYNATIPQIDISDRNLPIAEYLISKGANFRTMTWQKFDLKHANSKLGGPKLKIPEDVIGSISLSVLIFYLYISSGLSEIAHEITPVINLGVIFGGLMLPFVGISALRGEGYYGTSLHNGCYMGNVGVVRMLLGKGVNPNVGYRHASTLIRSVHFDPTPLGLTAMIGNTIDSAGNGDSIWADIIKSIVSRVVRRLDGSDIEIVRLLLKNGARKDLAYTHSQLKCWNINKIKKLYPYKIATIFENYSLSAMLLFGEERTKEIAELRNLITTQTPTNKRVLLQRAVQLNSLELVKQLLKEPIEFNEKSSRVKSPLHWAATMGYTNLVDPLIKAHKASLYISDRYGRMPLHNATSECIPLLIKAGSKINARDWRGWTPLHWAVHWADVDRVRELLKAGADPKIKNKKGQMPIWFIARDYKTFVPGAFTKPIVDLLKNPALAIGPVASSSTSTLGLGTSISSVTSTSQSRSE